MKYNWKDYFKTKEEMDNYGYSCIIHGCYKKVLFKDALTPSLKKWIAMDNGNKNLHGNVPCGFCEIAANLDNDEEPCYLCPFGEVFNDGNECTGEMSTIKPAVMITRLLSKTLAEAIERVDKKLKDE